MSLHEKTLYFFLMTENVVFVSGFYGLLLLKKKKKDRSWRHFLQEVFEVWTFSVVVVSSSTAFLISGLKPVSIFLTEQ